MCQAGDLILKEDELKLTPSGPCGFVAPLCRTGVLLGPRRSGPAGRLLRHPAEAASLGCVALSPPDPRGAQGGDMRVPWGAGRAVGRPTLFALRGTPETPCPGLAKLLMFPGAKKMKSRPPSGWREIQGRGGALLPPGAGGLPQSFWDRIGPCCLLKGERHSFVRTTPWSAECFLVCF